MSPRLAYSLAAIAALPAQAEAETKIVTATSPWKMDYAANECRLQRGFGTPDAPVLLQITQLAPGDRIYVTVAGKAFGSIDENSDVTLSTAPDSHDPISTRLTLGDMQAADGTTLTTLLFAGTTLNGFSEGGKPPVPVTPEREAGVTSLIVSWGKNAVQIGTGPLGKTMAAMHTCTDTLVKSWGLDPAQQASLKERPHPATPTSGWFPPNSYPSDLAAEGRQAIVEVRLLVDAVGAPTGCTVVEGYNEPRFAKATCDQIIKRARFKPAIDAAGQPAASYYITRVQWVIDRRPRVIRRGNRQDGRPSVW